MPRVTTGSASAFWRPWEETVRSYSGVHNLIDGIFKKWAEQGRVFAWRGVVNSEWPLHSSLYRRLLLTRRSSTSATAAPPLEADLQKAEGDILADVHRWGLHSTEQGRLSVMAQLAKLQHFGAPTRMIDVTFNPYIALWFAVEQQHENGAVVHENQDGRLFAIDVTKRLINEKKDRRPWEDDLKVPWQNDRQPDDWCKKALAWRPPSFEKRIAAQNGGFLLGGVPMAPPQYPKGPGTNDRWRIDEVRQYVSIPIRLHVLDPQAGGVGADGQPAYTIRISASAKAEVRARLKQLFGYEYRNIYPDYPGFATHGTPGLRSRP